MFDKIMEQGRLYDKAFAAISTNMTGINPAPGFNGPPIAGIDSLQARLKLEQHLASKPSKEDEIATRQMMADLNFDFTEWERAIRNLNEGPLKRPKLTQVKKMPAFELDGKKDFEQFNELLIASSNNACDVASKNKAKFENRLTAKFKLASQ